MDPKSFGSRRPTSGSQLEGDVATVGISQVRRRPVDRPDHDRAAGRGHAGSPPARASARSRASRRSATCTRRSAARSSRSTSQVAEQRPAPRRRSLRQGLADQGPGRRPVDRRELHGSRRLREEGGRRRSLIDRRPRIIAVAGRRSTASSIRRRIDHVPELEPKHMAYIANTPDDVRVMLGAIGLDSLDQLFDMIPAELRLKRPLAIPPALTELELTDRIQARCWPEPGRRPAGLLPGRRELRPLHPGGRRQPGRRGASSTRPTRPTRPRPARGRSRRPSSIRR